MAVRTTVTGGPLTGKAARHAGVGDLEGIKEIMQSLREAVPLCELVPYWSEYCLAMLRDVGINKGPDEVLDGVQKKGYRHPDAEWYCGEIVQRAHVIGKVVESGNSWVAVGLAVQLGKLIKEFQVRGYEKPLLTGLGIHETLGTHRKLATQKRRKRSKKWQSVALALAQSKWSEKPNLPATQVAKSILRQVQAAADPEQVPNYDTVRRFIAKAKKVGTNG